MKYYYLYLIIHLLPFFLLNTLTYIIHLLFFSLRANSKLSLSKLNIWRINGHGGCSVKLPIVTKNKSCEWVTLSEIFGQATDPSIVWDAGYLFKSLEISCTSHLYDRNWLFFMNFFFLCSSRLIIFLYSFICIKSILVSAIKGPTYFH